MAKQYEATTNVVHNGESYKPGDVIAGLSAADAERLVKLSAAVEVEGEEEEGEKTASSKTNKKK